MVHQDSSQRGCEMFNKITFALVPVSALYLTRSLQLSENLLYQRFGEGLLLGPILFGCAIFGIVTFLASCKKDTNGNWLFVESPFLCIAVICTAITICMTIVEKVAHAEYFTSPDLIYTSAVLSGIWVTYWWGHLSFPKKTPSV